MPHMNTISVENLLKRLKTRREGLDDQEVVQRRLQEGDNSFFHTSRTWWKVARNHLFNPFMLMFFVMVVTLAGMREWANAFLILCCMIINTVVSFVQEYRALQKLSFLKKHLELSALVYRSGVRVQVPFSDLVCGDIIVLNPGDIIPADVRFIIAQSLLVDESPVSGESGVVSKITYDQQTIDSSTVTDESSWGFAGTTIVQGAATAVIEKVGRGSSWGRLATLTFETLKTSNLARQTQQLASFIMRFVIIVLIIILCVNIIIKNLLSSSERIFTIADLLVFSVALAVTVIPEALPVVVTLCLVRGASHMAAHSVVVKRLSAVEDLGRITILCTDKTGTLTENKLRIVSLYGADEPMLITHAALCAALTPAKPFIPGFDHAIYEYGTHHYPEFLIQCANYQRESELPFDPVSRIGAVVVSHAQSDKLLIIRGSYEHVLSRCITPSFESSALAKWINDQESQGNRIIAVAYSTLSAHVDLDSTVCNGLNFVGALSFADPIKKSAYKAVSHAQKLGITVKIISGDSALVCAHVAHEIGLISCRDQRIITGPDFAAMAEEEKKNIVQEHHVFARILPEQKYEIITLLEKDHTVGYIGDGINDAPALRASDVSLVVKDGSSLAQDVADIVLLKESLLAVIEGVSEGRRIVANTLKYIGTTLAASFGNFYSLAIVSFLVDYLPMLPSQILLLNIMSDVPLILLSTDAVDYCDIQYPCRYQFRDIIIIALIIGSVGTVFDFIFFALYHTHAPAAVQTGWFIYAIFREISLIFSLRTRNHWFYGQRPSLHLILAALITVTTAISLPFIPGIREMLHFVSPAYSQIFIIFVLVGTYFIVVDWVKWWYYKRLARVKSA